MGWKELIQLANARKGKRKPAHDEDDLQIACREWFGMQYPAIAFLLHHSPNEGLLPKGARDGAKRKLMGVRAGFPDFILLHPNAHHPYLCIELKTATGRQSPAQHNYQVLVESVGGLYFIVRSVDVFASIVNDYLSDKL